MNAFYERAGITIHLGDCRDILPTLNEQSVALLVTDPPYGQDYQSNYRANALRRIAGDDGTLDVGAALHLAAPAIRYCRHAYVFGKFELQPPFRVCAELVWDKGMLGSGDVTSCWGPQHEPIMFALRSRDNGAVSMARGNAPARMRQGSVLRYLRPNARHVKRHPTEKPVALLRRLIESSSFPGECVLDPFVGCGSTLVASIAEGRTAVGIELDEGYAQIAAARCDRALDAMASINGALS